MSTLELLTEAEFSALRVLRGEHGFSAFRRQLGLSAPDADALLAGRQLAPDVTHRLRAILGALAEAPRPRPEDFGVPSMDRPELRTRSGTGAKASGLAPRKGGPGNKQRVQKVLARMPRKAQP